MSGKLIGALVMGLAGTAVLLGLGVWQVQRLEWKRGILSEIETRISAEPVALPLDPEPEIHRFLPVAVEGEVLPPALRVVTTDDGGPAFRIVSPLQVADRTVLLDRGIVAADAPPTSPPAGRVTVTGNLHWPDEADAFTPAPDVEEGLWYARDLSAMATVLGTEPVMIVAREVPGDTVSPRPINAAGIPNDHLEYAVTWFSLAAVWAGMTAALVWRIRRRIG